MTQIIGIAGKAGSGKDTVAEYLESTYANCYVESFARPLKFACAAAFGMDIEQFTSREQKEQVDHRWGVSPRQIAQFVGTELFRDGTQKLLGLDGNFWVQRMQLLIDGMLLTENGGRYDENDTVIISDVRFQNEIEWILNSGGSIIAVLRSEATGDVGISGHASEQGFELPVISEQWVKILNDGTKEQLYETVESALDGLPKLMLHKSILVNRVPNY